MLEYNLVLEESVGVSQLKTKVVTRIISVSSFSAMKRRGLFIAFQEKEDPIDSTKNEKSEGSNEK